MYSLGYLLQVNISIKLHVYSRKESVLKFDLPLHKGCVNTSKLVPFKCLEQQTLLCSEAIHDFSMSSSQSFSCLTLKSLRSSPKGKRLKVNVLWLECVITSRLEQVNLKLYSHRASATCSAIPLLLIAYYRPQTKLWEGNLFTPACHREGALSDRDALDRDHPGQRSPRTEITRWTETPPGQRHPYTVKSGRYAYSWNAFLYIYQ